jgi:hypothetical protein
MLENKIHFRKVISCVDGPMTDSHKAHGICQRIGLQVLGQLNSASTAL